MTARVFRTVRAKADIVEIHDFLAARNLQAADRLIDQILSRIEGLADFPQSGAARDDIAPGLRHLVVAPYLILYRFTPGEVLVIRVVDGRRDLTTITPPLPS